MPNCARVRLVRTLDLRNELACTDNGTGHQLREKAHVKAEVQQVAHRLQLAAVNIHRIAHALERIEADADREQDLVLHEVRIPRGIGPVREDVHRCEGGAQHGVHIVHHEVRVLEETEHQQVDRDAGCQHQAFAKERWGGFAGATEQEVEHDGEGEQAHEEPARFPVEEQADRKEPGAAHQVSLVHKGVNGEYHREKAPKEEARENERRRRVVLQYRQPIGACNG